ncbi:MAG: hypothetical protein WDZ31_07330 [Phycisphaeraceae bacterium]
MADIKNPEHRGSESSGREPEHGFREQAREKASEVTNKTRSAAASARDRVSHQAHDISEKGKHRAAEAIGDIATAIREAGHKLHDENQEGPARYVDQAADQIDSVARYLEQHDVNDLVESAEDMARRQPLIFLGAAFATGLIAARFLRSSSERSSKRRSGSRQPETGASAPSYAAAEETSFLESETEAEFGGVEGTLGGERRSPDQPARPEDVPSSFSPESPDVGQEPGGPEAPGYPPGDEGKERP